MPQHFRLDRLRAVSYLCLVAACVSRPPAQPTPALPGLAPSEAASWAASTAPIGHRLTRFRWLFNDGQASVGGQGSARVAGPDSLRFDIAGPFGIGGAAAMVVGDEPRWVQPPDIIARLIPSYPLMWAMFGVMRPPPGGARSSGLREGKQVRLGWVRGADTVRYLREPGALRAEWQRAGTTMGVVETRLDADGRPVSARLTVPSVPARLDLTIVADSVVPAFPPTVWVAPAP
ncbi:MAG TPA: hypothetical protein VFV65_02235 [Gemmatimonadales bacterium]|nr:hypothetical protein [Gemmatimonadales bacterium]